VRTAYARRGAAYLTMPNDLQVAKAGENPYAEVGPARTPATAPVRLSAPGRPSAGDLQQLADVLNASTKPAILAGAGSPPWASIGPQPGAVYGASPGHLRTGLEIPRCPNGQRWPGATSGSAICPAFRSANTPGQTKRVSGHSCGAVLL
jgi:hypothetical protein